MFLALGYQHITVAWKMFLCQTLGIVDHYSHTIDYLGYFPTSPWGLNVMQSWVWCEQKISSLFCIFLLGMPQIWRILLWPYLVVESCCPERWNRDFSTSLLQTLHSPSTINGFIYIYIYIYINNDFNSVLMLKNDQIFKYSQKGNFYFDYVSSENIICNTWGIQIFGIFFLPFSLLFVGHYPKGVRCTPPLHITLNCIW